MNSGMMLEGDPRTRPFVWFARPAHVGDVVAFTHPSPVDGAAPGVLVRRVVALQGDVLESGEEDEPDFVIPDGHAWVAADNHDVPAEDASDSRSFGPLPLANLVGRVIYAARSASDHGVVHNSEAAAAVDQPVLQVELDVEALTDDL